MSGRWLLRESRGFVPGFDLVRLERPWWLMPFEDDVAWGGEAERLFGEVLLLPFESVEVKRDGRAHETGNLFIEAEQGSPWRPSGLSVTKARLWVFVLASGTMIVETPERLRELTAGLPLVEQKRDGLTPARGFVLPIRDLLRVQKISFGAVDEA